MLRQIRGFMFLLGVSALVIAHAEPSVSDVNAAIQSGQYQQAEQMIKQAAPNHPDAPRVHYMMALVLSHMPGREEDARRELAEAMSINPQLPFADSSEISALQDHLRPHEKASGPLPASMNQPFVPHLQRPPESFYERAMDFLQKNNIAAAAGVGVIAVALILFSILRKKKKDGIAPMKAGRKEKKSRRREPELPVEGQEAETFDYGNSPQTPGEHRDGQPSEHEIQPWEAEPHHGEHDDFARH